MKSSQSRNFFILILNQLTTTHLCSSYLSSLQLWLLGLFRSEQASRMKASVKEIWNNLKRGSWSNSVPADRGDVVTNLRHHLHRLHNSLAVAKAFPRFLIGLVLLVWLAPYADIFYTRLDFNDRVSPEVWYYESYHWLFLCLGPYLKSIFYTLGLYLIFARGSSILSFIAAYALMYDIGKVFWLIQVSNHDEYKSLPTGWFLGYGFIAGAFLIVLFDKLTFWLNHRVEAIKRRLHGIKSLVGKVDDRTVVTHFVQTVEDDLKVQQFKQY